MLLFHAAKEVFEYADEYASQRNPISDFVSRLYCSLTLEDAYDYALDHERNWILIYDIEGDDIDDVLDQASSRGLSIRSFGTKDLFDASTTDGLEWGTLIFASRIDDSCITSEYQNTDVIFGPRADIQANYIVHRYYQEYRKRKWDYRDPNDIATMIAEIDPWKYEDQIAFSPHAAGIIFANVDDNNWYQLDEIEEMFNELE